MLIWWKLIQRTRKGNILKTPKQGNNKNVKKSKRNCYNCEKVGYRLNECKKPKKQTYQQQCASCTDIRKNLVPSALLNNSGFKFVFVSKFVCAKYYMYKANDYLYDGLSLLY